MRMNLFLLSWDVEECARYHCDKHVVKMILELVQMLYTSWHLNDGHVPRTAPKCLSTGEPGYKKISNHNHPMAKWVRASRSNYIFTVRLACALCLEYNYRYDGKQHSCATHVVWLAENLPTFTVKERTVIPQCMPDQYKCEADNPIKAYQNYYIGDKKRFATWKERFVPSFFTQ